MKRRLNQEIINYLNHQSDFVTSEQIAHSLGVSKTTVIRRITEINSSIENGNQIILSERGRGVKLNPATYIKLKNSTEESVAEERCNEIMKELLFAAPKRILTYDVYKNFYVSESVIAKDKLILAKKLEKWNLTLVRSNRHMSVVGCEKDIRAAIMEIVLQLNHTTDILSLEEYCKKINNGNDFLFAIKQIEFASTALGMPINYPYNISLFSHIYVMMDRIRLCRYVSLYDRRRDLLREEKLLLPEIYSVCKKIIDNIGHYIGVIPDESELVYLFEYLSTARISKDNAKKINSSISSQIAQSYIKKVSEKMRQTFSNQLYYELENHIRYLVQRLLNSVYLPNALLNDIQVEYKTIYKTICETSIEVAKEFNLPNISEDEAGFISLYFAKYLELDRKKINVYIVCTTGIGTSELISVKIRQTFPMINIVGITSNITISKILKSGDEQIDLLITTIPISQQLNIPTVLVSSILTNRDIETVKHVMEELGCG